MVVLTVVGGWCPEGNAQNHPPTPVWWGFVCSDDVSLSVMTQPNSRPNKNQPPS